MKVVLSVQPIRFPVTGIGRYTYELARHLPSIDEIEDLRYFSDYSFVDVLPSAEAVVDSRTPSVVTRLKHRLARNGLLLNYYRKRVQSRRAATLSDYSEYIYHGPNFYLPPFPGKSVVTIHDLSVFTMPHNHPVERVKFLTKEVEFALTQATMLLTDSHFTRHEVSEYFGWPLEKVGVAALAGGPEFYPRAAQEVSSCLQGYGLTPDGYTLYAGTIEPRKNLERLFYAYSRLPIFVRNQYPLILAGFKGWNNDTIMQCVSRGEREGWLRYVGFVPSNELPLLFAGARLFAFPSLYEGFGLPVVEAMASGVPVVTSTSSSLPEVVGNAGATCSPEDVESMTQLLERGLLDKSWRAEAIERGLFQASKFTWQRCARETTEVYRTVSRL